MYKYIIPKEFAKRCLQFIAAKFGPHARKPESPKLLVLMYHRILPLNDIRVKTEEPGMIVTPETFKKHLEILSEYFQFTTISQWVEGNNFQNKHSHACAITFDDGWLDNYEFAYPILKELNIPATIYIVTDMIGTNKTFWPERLVSLIHSIYQKSPKLWSSPDTRWLRDFSNNFDYSTSIPNENDIAQIIDNLKNLTDMEINKQLDSIEKKLSIDSVQPPSLLSWEQVTEMSNSNLVEIGCHTSTHTRLNKNIMSDVLHDEIVRSKKIIEAQISKPVKTFCFPNGDFNEEALNLVRENYIGAVTTQTGWNPQDSDNFILKRFGVHEDSTNDKISFLSRISGWI